MALTASGNLYRTFKICYERETYLFVNELSRSEISTFAKLRISSHDLRIEKGRHRKIIQVYLIITLSLGSIEKDHVISETMLYK